MTALREALERYWGYTTFRPLQQEAMNAVLASRDSLVVLPTGGGKSLCFQAPALVRPGPALVVSPLISLMKDQVDTLIGNGVPAGALQQLAVGRRESDGHAGTARRTLSPALCLTRTTGRRQRRRLSGAAVVVPGQFCRYRRGPLRQPMGTRLQA